MPQGVEHGARYLEDHVCEFAVWRPRGEKTELRLHAPEPRLVSMERHDRGYWKATVEGVPPGSLYSYVLDGSTERPDPASHFQPRGVHGPSRTVDHRAFPWTDQLWRGIDLSRTILYEIHTGTFTPEGTFDGILGRLDELAELGVTALEIMPVAQFPGPRNWGYDGAYPFAVQDSYGGPDGLKRLVNGCHEKGLSVILDVVYNHLGPEGNYLRDFGPYFTDRYRTPWGEAVNFDGPWSDEVRGYFIQNALHWMESYHVDGLRLDAVHAIYDLGARHFLEELKERVEDLSGERGRRLLCIAESDLNDPRLVRPRELGGYGLDAQWSDDFHHSVHALLTGERQGYYEDFGRMEHVLKALRDGFVYDGEYSPYRKRTHGAPCTDRPGSQLVVALQNHDQVGNRMNGERLSRLADEEALKPAAALLLLSPYVPLLFMGEEYGETAPFLYFTSHADEDLVRAVRQGRKEEFQAFQWDGEPPDPQSEETFLRSRLDWASSRKGRRRLLREFHRTLMELRKSLPSLRTPDRRRMEVQGKGRTIFMLRRRREHQIFALFNLGGEPASWDLALPPGTWRKVLESSESRWGGPGGTLPEKAESGETVRLAGYGFGLFEKD